MPEKKTYMRIIHKNKDRVIQDIREMQYSFTSKGYLNHGCSSQLAFMLDLVAKGDIIEVSLVKE
jgi:hypothetical protein